MHTNYFTKEHFTNSIILSDRKDELTISAICESSMKVDPDRIFLGVTENISSMPPVFVEPYPTFILILNSNLGTYLGKILYSSLSICSSTDECDPVWRIFKSICRVTWK